MSGKVVMHFVVVLVIGCASVVGGDAEVNADKDPCEITLALNSTLRSPENYVEDLEIDGFLCDRLLRAKWYHFQTWDAGSSSYQYAKMHESCPSDHTCGTHSPAYLNAQYAGHPEEGDGVVEREVCASLNGNCCLQRWRINIKNCGRFMAYKLADVPGCYMAYCAA